MQSEKIVLIPPTHEVSTPSFHVRKSLSAIFVQYLDHHGIHVTEPPRAIGETADLEEIRVEEGTSMETLNGLMFGFLDQEGLPPDAA